MIRQTNRLALAVAGVAGAVGSAAAAHAAEPTTQELMQQIDALKAKVEQLQTTQEQQQQSFQKADVDATVASVLRDAERRSSLMQNDMAMTGGYQDGHFFLKSADDNFLLRPRLQLQVRHVTNYRDEADIDGDSDIQSGFEIRRAKFGFDGHVFTPKLEYNFLWQTDQDGGGVFLQDAFAQYRINDQWAVRGGQFKDPVFHEELVSSNRQLAVDRSLLNELLGGGQTDRMQGIGAIWDPTKQLHVMMVFHDGYNSDNTDFRDAGGTAAVGVAPTNWGVAGRAEYLAMGNRSDYNDFSADGVETNLLVVGAGADLSQGGDGNVFFHTVDAQYETTLDGHGLGVYGALVGVYRDSSDIAAGEDKFYDWGLLAQAGYMLDRNWEVFGRWDMTLLDEDALAPGVEDTVHELTGGVNYYLYGHNAKFTIDLSYLPNGSPSEQSGIGVLAGDEDSFVLRAQFNLFL